MVLRLGMWHEANGRAEAAETAYRLALGGALLGIIMVLVQYAIATSDLISRIIGKF